MLSDRIARPFPLEFRDDDVDAVLGAEIERVAPFGGFLSAFRAFQGCMLPMHVEAGNFFGTRDSFPFYKARVRAIRFLYDEPKSR